MEDEEPDPVLVHGDPIRRQLAVRLQRELKHSNRPPESGLRAIAEHAGKSIVRGGPFLDAD